MFCTERKVELIKALPKLGDDWRRAYRSQSNQELIEWRIAQQSVDVIIEKTRCPHLNLDRGTERAAERFPEASLDTFC